MAQRDYYDKLAFPFERNLQRPFYDVTTPEEVTGRFDSTSDPSTTAPAALDAGPLPELDPSEFPADPGLKRGTSGAYEGQGKGVSPAFRGFYPQDTSFEDKIDPKYQAHSTSGVGYFDVAPNQQDPNAYDRDPRDYKSPQDPQGQEAQKRYWLRSYLEQKMKKAGDFGQLDQAKIDQNRVTDIADYGHGLDRMFTARSAALGGQGVNENFWRGMKQDAAGRTALADDARKSKIQEYMMSQRLGSEGVAEMDRIRKSQFEAAMQDPTSPVSRSAQFAFKKNFPDQYSQMVDENGQNMVQHMTGADIQQMIKNREAESKMRIAEGYNQATIDKMTSEEEAKKRELEIKFQDAADRASLRPSRIKKEEAEADLYRAKADSMKNAPQLPKGAQPGPTGVRPTLGQQSVDRDYAKKYNEWVTTGRASYEKNMSLLKKTRDELAKTSDDSFVSGRIAGTLPDFMRSNESIRYQDDVRQAAQSSLRATLGAQFTEKEGERIMSAAYNSKLPPSENIKKIDRAIAELESNARSNEDMKKYYEANGTLQGFKSSEMPKEASSSGPKPGDIEDGHEFLGGDPSKKENWKAVK